MKNATLKIDHCDTYILVQETVNEIKPLDQTLTYELNTLDIPKAAGLKINEINFQPLKTLTHVNIWNYEGGPQTVDLGMFKDLDKLDHIDLFSNRIAKVENNASGCILPNLERFDLSYNKLTNFDFGVIKCSQKLKHKRQKTAPR